MSDGSFADSLTRHIAMARAPGGILTRKSTLVLAAGIGVGLGIVAYLILGAVRGEPNPAAVRFGDAAFAKVPTQSFIATDALIGRREIRTYGKLDDTLMDATLVLTMPPAGQSLTRDFDLEVGELPPLRNTKAVLTGTYDFATRFGGYRAVEFNLDLEVRWKQCFAFMSRFESPAVYVKGWLCEEVGKKTSADRIACLLDGLSFASVASAEADAFLQTRAVREPLCAVRRMPDAGLRLRRR